MDEWKTVSGKVTGHNPHTLSIINSFGRMVVGGIEPVTAEAIVMEHNKPMSSYGDVEVRSALDIVEPRMWSPEADEIDAILGDGTPDDVFERCAAHKIQMMLDAGFTKDMIIAMGVMFQQKSGYWQPHQ